MTDDHLDDIADNIIAQIKNQGKTLKKVEKEYQELKKEDLEKFVIDNASMVIQDSVEMVQALKDDVVSGGDAKTIEAVSELVKAVTGAIDSLAKLKLSDDKIKSQKEIKLLDIEAKKAESNEQSTKGITFSREEILNRLLTIKETPKIEDTTIDV